MYADDGVTIIGEVVGDFPGVDYGLPCQRWYDGPGPQYMESLQAGPIHVAVAENTWTAKANKARRLDEPLYFAVTVFRPSGESLRIHGLRPERQLKYLREEVARQLFVHSGLVCLLRDTHLFNEEDMRCSLRTLGLREGDELACVVKAVMVADIEGRSYALTQKHASNKEEVQTIVVAEYGDEVKVADYCRICSTKRPESDIHNFLEEVGLEDGCSAAVQYCGEVVDSITQNLFHISRDESLVWRLPPPARGLPPVARRSESMPVLVELGPSFRPDTEKLEAEEALQAAINSGDDARVRLVLKKLYPGMKF